MLNTAFSIASQDTPDKLGFALRLCRVCYRLCASLKSQDCLPDILLCCTDQHFCQGSGSAPRVTRAEPRVEPRAVQAFVTGAMGHSALLASRASPRCPMLHVCISWFEGPCVTSSVSGRHCKGRAEGCLQMCPWEHGALDKALPACNGFPSHPPLHSHSSNSSSSSSRNSSG